MASLAYYVARLNQRFARQLASTPGRAPTGWSGRWRWTPPATYFIGGDFTAYRFHQPEPHRAADWRQRTSGGVIGYDSSIRAQGPGILCEGGGGGLPDQCHHRRQFHHRQRHQLARSGASTPTGALDTNFNPGTDVNGPVYSLAVQPADNKIVIGGSFSQVNLTNLNSIARINFNGSVDNNFAPGDGINGPVYCLAIQPDQKIWWAASSPASSRSAASVTRACFQRLGGHQFHGYWKQLHSKVKLVNKSNKSVFIYVPVLNDPDGS